MELGQLITQLEGHVEAPVVAIDGNGTTYTITEVVKEAHELGSTIWLKIEEN